MSKVARLRAALVEAAAKLLRVDHAEAERQLKHLQRALNIAFRE